MAKPHIVFLPGLDGTGNLLNDVAEKLSASHSVTILDHDVQVSDYQTLTAAVRNRLPNEPFWIVAESFSGPIGGALALDPPENLKGVIFAATFVTPPSPWPWWIVPLAKIFPLRRRWALTLARPLFMGSHKAPEIFENLVRTIQSVPQQTLVGRLVEVHKLPKNPVFSFKVPTIFLKARHEKFLWGACMRDLEGRVDETLVYDAPHFLLQICPAQAARDISERVGRKT